MVAKVAISAFDEAERAVGAAVLALIWMRLRSEEGETARGADETNPAVTRQRPKAWRPSISEESGRRIERRR